MTDDFTDGFLNSLLPDARIQIDSDLAETWAMAGSNIPQQDPETGLWFASLLGIAHHVSLMTALDQVGEAQPRPDFLEDAK